MLADNEIYDLLNEARTIAIVGLSDNPNRASHAVARFLQRNGYRIIPVNPHLTEPVLGEYPVASLRDLHESVDIVNVFRDSAAVPAIVDDAIAIGAGAIWMQQGIEHKDAAQRARIAGLPVVMDRCIAVDHRRVSRYAEMELAAV